MARYSEKRRAALETTMRDEVLRVATGILREEGFPALTMERIAREIGVSRGTLYNYFADADAVLVFVEERTFEPIKREVESVAASDLSADAKLEGILRSVFDRLYSDRALALALFAKQELHGPRAEQKKHNHRDFLDLLEGIVEEGIASRTFREVSPRLAAEVILGSTTGYIETMLYSGEFRTGDEIAPGMMDVLLSGLQARPPTTRSTAPPGNPRS